MSLVECNPNHCPSVIEMGKSLITQEIKIKELEQEKVELIEAYKYVIKNGIFELAQVRNEICNVLNKYRI